MMLATILMFPCLLTRESQYQADYEHGVWVVSCFSAWGGILVYLLACLLRIVPENHCHCGSDHRFGSAFIQSWAGDASGTWQSAYLDGFSPASAKGQTECVTTVHPATAFKHREYWQEIAVEILGGEMFLGFCVARRDERAWMRQAWLID